MSDSPGPELRRLIVGGSSAGWARAGFVIDGDSTVIGSVAVRFDEGAEAGVVGWELSGLPAASNPAGIDGIATWITTETAPSPVTHPNGVSRLDHVVIRTPDLPRTISALEAAGFEVRRTREVPGSDPAVSQVFLWAGEAILEVVGRREPPTVDDDRARSTPARIWGLALTTDDLDGAARLLAPNIGGPRPAVQPGRRIATIDTSTLGIGPALALMSAHPGRGRLEPDGE